MWPHEGKPSGAPPERERRLNADAAGAQAADEQRGSASRARAEHMNVRVAVGHHAPAIARMTVERWLFGRVSRRKFDDVRLLISELVTNSVRHAGRTGDANICVTVTIADGVVRLEVEDGGDAAIAAVPPDREHGGGFGLFIVDALAQHWGSSHDGRTRVWAELAV